MARVFMSEAEGRLLIALLEKYAARQNANREMAFGLASRIDECLEKQCQPKCKRKTAIIIKIAADSVAE